MPLSMRVIFLDIDGVLNCSKTKNPRDFPTLLIASCSSASKHSCGELKQGLSFHRRGGSILSGFMPPSITAFLLTMYALTCPIGLDRMKFAHGYLTRESVDLWIYSFMISERMGRAADVHPQRPSIARRPEVSAEAGRLLHNKCEVLFAKGLSDHWETATPGLAA